MTVIMVHIHLNLVLGFVLMALPSSNLCSGKQKIIQTPDVSAIDLNNEELQQAMEEFALMSDSEMEEAYAEVLEILGDDPEAIAAMKTVMEEVRQMNADDITSKHRLINFNDEIAEATQIALDMLSTSDYSVVFEKRHEILEAVIETGKISSEDAKLFKSDSKMWEEFLRDTWDELQRQALVSSLEHTEL